MKCFLLMLFFLGEIIIAHSKTFPIPTTKAKQVFLIDCQTKTILYEKNPYEKMAPSSMTKMMTTYVVLNQLKQGIITLGMKLPVSKKAWKTGGSKMFVPVHGMISIEDLLRGIIIQSGNDACIVIAEGLSGSEEEFVEEMNQKAQEIGAFDTHFVNAHGLNEPNHYSTAYDLALIGMRLIDDFPEYYRLHSETEFTFNKTKQWNRNPLLYKKMGCDGIKTGHTDAGGFGLVASVVQDGRRLILVFNGLSSMQERSNEAIKLIQWGFHTFSNVVLYKAGQLIQNVFLLLGKEDELPLTVEQDCVLTVPKLYQKEIKIELTFKTPLEAPIQKGMEVGKMIITVPFKEVPFEVPLVAAVSVEKAGFLKRIKDIIHYFFWENAKKKV